LDGGVAREVHRCVDRSRNARDVIALRIGLERDSDGPAVFDTSLDYGAMIKTLAQAHIAASASDSAGAYLCNFVSYSSYEYLAQVDPDTATLFVHVPPIASLESPQDKRILNQLVAALKIIIESANKQIMFVTYSSSQVD